MYKATKQWQPNQYMERLVKDGVLYFLVYVSIPSLLLLFPFVPLPLILLSAMCRQAHLSGVFSLSRFHLSSSYFPTHLALEYMHRN